MSSSNAKKNIGKSLYQIQIQRVNIYTGNYTSQ